MSSVQGIQLSGKISEQIQEDISATVLYDYPTIETLSQYLMGDQSANSEIIESNTKSITQDEIAVISMTCRFPDANSTKEFFQNLLSKKDSIREIPQNRWDIDNYYSAEIEEGKMNTRWGGFLNQVENFDASFFKISPKEAELMDPQQRLLLEASYELLERAGYPMKAVKGQPVGVFMGISQSHYEQLLLSQGTNKTAYTGTGAAFSISANRLSYFYDFRGPSMAIDTACSSSLVAVHQAVKALQSGECNMAMAGGVNLLLTPETSVALSQAGMMAIDGRCKAFDASANGYVRSEGVGMVLLKPLAQAQKDGDKILGVIKGSAINQDGRSNGLTAPNGLAQQAVIKKALNDAKVSAKDVDYVECHGTGNRSR